ncbi:MAG: adenosylcobinamide-GDP ribazoletransferase [Bradymonadaceae bacterium]
MEPSNRQRWKRRLGPLYGLAVALQFMTRLPVPSDLDPDTEDLADSAVWFPMVGAIVGGVLWLVVLSLRASPLVPSVTAAGVIVTAVLLTGAFHEDALGDTADGLGGGWTRTQMLEIMRDSRVGTYATVAIAALLGIRFVLLLGMRPTVWGPALLTAHVAGRASSLGMLATMTYARRDDEDPGFGKSFVDAQTTPRLLTGAATAAGLCGLAAGWIGVAGLALAAPVCAATALYYRDQIDGMTGDCLGATNVLTEVSVLLLFASLAPAQTSPWIAT